MTAEAMVSILGVTRSFTVADITVEALIDVSAQIRTGEVTVVAGPSGSGKTTLLTILAGHETKDSGRIDVRAPLPQAAPIETLNWGYVGYLPQTPALLDELTVQENIELPNRLLSRRRTRSSAWAVGPWDTPTLMSGLQIAHLAARYPSQTSGGEQQRTALARALRLAPPLLIADEPTGHQDRARVHMVLEVLKGYANSGRAVVIASHDDEVIASADALIRMRDGRMEVDRALL